MTNNHPYDKLFLQDDIGSHQYFFQKLATNEKYDFFSLVDTYMQTSAVRAKTDIGNLIALNTSHNGYLNSIDYTKCKEKNSSAEEIPSDIAKWMASIYDTLQWEYNLYSKEISECLPAQELYSLYDKHCSNSLKGACRNIYREYLTDIVPIHEQIEKTESKEEESWRE